MGRSSLRRSGQLRWSTLSRLWTPGAPWTPPRSATFSPSSVNPSDQTSPTPDRRRSSADRRPGGSSSWQSLQRRTGNIETDYLNGVIVRLGQQNGIAIPVNSLLTRLANDAAAQGLPPGSVPETQLLRQLRGRPRRHTRRMPRRDPPEAAETVGQSHNDLATCPDKR
ncbi:ketopantoate reductase family protein [Mycobacterium sp.]|uniref:ketopantoate reductase family protein n=1 Tax=Mycobacterium sp. TaxID=1785 RepID=UPI003F97218F